MFQAKVYKLCIANVGISMREERVAQDIVAKWNYQNSEEKGVVFLHVSEDAKPDFYVFVVDNYMDATKVETAVATGAKVILLCAVYHDPRNTISSEVKAIKDYQAKLKGSCFFLEFMGMDDFSKKVNEIIEMSLDSKFWHHAHPREGQELDVITTEMREAIINDKII